MRKSGGLSEDWKKLSVWSSVLFLVFALEMCKREAYRTDGIKRVYPSQQGHDRFMQVSYTVSWILQILSAIINVRSRLNIYQIVSLFHWFKDVFGLLQQKKIKSLGNSDNRTDQKTGRNDDNLLGIPRANLELKHMFILCS